MFGKWFGKHDDANTAIGKPVWSIAQSDDDPDVIYAIGDVHGCLNLLAEIEDLIRSDADTSSGRKHVVMMGDYVDRGPDTFGVLSKLCSGSFAGLEMTCLAGNHESMMLDYLGNPSRHPSWLDHGGLQTLVSYGIDPNMLHTGTRANRTLQLQLDASIPHEHIQFLNSLTLLQRFGGLVFVHAGIDRSKPIDRQVASQVLWKYNKPDEDDAPPTVVHGHSPYDEVYVSDHRIGVDTGAFQTGRLSAAKFISGRYTETIATNV